MNPDISKSLSVLIDLPIRHLRDYQLSVSWAVLFLPTWDLPISVHDSFYYTISTLLISRTFFPSELDTWFKQHHLYKPEPHLNLAYISKIPKSHVLVTHYVWDTYVWSLPVTPFTFYFLLLVMWQKYRGVLFF